jgi:hypothetical protein
MVLKMKKLLAIVVLGLLWGGNVQAKEILLTCKSFNVTGYFKGGGRSVEPNQGDMIDIFKIDAKRKKISNYNSRSKKFLDIKKTKFSETTISWIKQWGDYTVYHEVNRFDSTYKNVMKYKSNPKWDEIITYYRCSVGDKKF